MYDRVITTESTPADRAAGAVLDRAPCTVEHVIVRPGDKLVIRVAESLNLADCDELRAMVAEHLPGVDVVAVFAEQMFVYRPDPA